MMLIILTFLGIIAKDHYKKSIYGIMNRKNSSTYTKEDRVSCINTKVIIN